MSGWNAKQSVSNALTSLCATSALATCIWFYKHPLRENIPMLSAICLACLIVVVANLKLSQPPALLSQAALERANLSDLANIDRG